MPPRAPKPHAPVDKQLQAELALPPTRRAALHRARTLARTAEDFAELLANPNAPEEQLAEAVEWVNRGWEHVFGHSLDFVHRMGLIDTIEIASGLVEAQVVKLDQVVEHFGPLLRSHWPDLRAEGAAGAFQAAVEAWPGRGRWKPAAALLEALGAMPAARDPAKSADSLRREWDRWRRTR